MDNVKKRIWIDALSIGNDEADYENHKLLEVMNDLDELIEYKKDRQEFAKILTKMTDYSLSHFKREEAYMKKMSYPLLSEHKKCHLDYIYKVATYNANLLSTNLPDPKDIIAFLENWWKNHILIHDAKFEKYKNEVEPLIPY